MHPGHMGRVVVSMQFATTRPESYVLEVPPADPTDAARHFLAKLGVEADASDVHTDLTKGVRGIVLVDARSGDAFQVEHCKGAVSFPYRTMTTETTKTLPKDKVIVVYCSGTHCNASTKAAARLASFGFKVKEMIGGLEAWKKEGFPTEKGQPVALTSRA